MKMGDGRERNQSRKREKAKYGKRKRNKVIRERGVRWGEGEEKEREEGGE